MFFSFCVFTYFLIRWWVWFVDSKIPFRPPFLCIIIKWFTFIGCWHKNKLQKIVKKYDPDVLIHLAALSHDGKSNKNPELAFRNSFETLFNSLESVKYLKQTR